MVPRNCDRGSFEIMVDAGVPAALAGHSGTRIHGHGGAPTGSPPDFDNLLRSRHLRHASHDTGMGRRVREGEASIPGRNLQYVIGNFEKRSSKNEDRFAFF